MAELELFIYDYNYSSWSMRAGVLLRAAGIPYAERRFHLDDERRAQIAAISPSKLLPLLVHGEVRVWDSLAIAEYVAELCPDLALWPRAAPARAVARAASAEMHSGFLPLRSAMPMNIRARYPRFPRTQEVERNVARIKELWSELRARFGQEGEFLCGEFGIVDAMFTPLVMRFRSYDVKLDGVCEAYAQAVLRHGAVQAWIEAARLETDRIPAYEFAVDG